MRIAKTAISLVLSASALLYGNSALAETYILASLKPLELLVRAVATEDMHTSTLVPAGSSPHNYSMAPSKRRALENADVIFWVGPEMETFLNRLLTGDEFGGRSVALMAPDADAASSERENQDHSQHNDKHGDGHDHGDGEDPHIWVDPQMAVTMAENIRDTLAGLDGTDKPALDRNLERFRAAVTQKEEQIREQLAPLQDVSLFAYHSAFTRFAEHYNLKVEGVLTLNPELSPGARHIADVQNSLRSANHPCLLTEPQFNRQWWRSITQGLDVKFSTWDPLATDIDATANGYAEFQQSIADAVLKCLPENAEH
ncbi:zinc transport system substrate-binding protein [Marinobacter sp. LV10R510-11A]|uniref:zinc ABC transporter substrate-binding protein n=1 Tax=Marinobacter sp. LV10R510-11A TaxID=1415568 RepID=UPI000BB83E3B|nr:zinc ABC transporter substrate-binding protein [Marinobacter sp. LV10R510-11A]SOB74925.1 zinc transport system substrate-binding protein [Marinobacter sp. LV10R510-11A]